MTADTFFMALQSLFAFPRLFYLIIGLILGIIVGAIPGIGPPVGMSLLLPLTIPLDELDAVVLLVALYVGAMYGGAVSAILVNVPGTPAAIASTFDGYPLSREGRATYALTVSLISSSIGVVVTAVALIVLTPVLVSIVLLFGTPQYLLLAIFGLVIIPIAVRGNTLKALFAASFGVLASTIGIAPMGSTPRFTLGIIDLFDGLNFIALLLGVFAIAEMIRIAPERGSIGKEFSTTEELDLVEGFRVVLSRPVSFLRSVTVGFIIGFIPAAGAAVSNIVAYAAEVRSSDDPDSYGTGNIRGLVASESSNSATIGSSLVPVLSFGIPGSASAAIILGGMLMHGLRPGPALFSEEIFISYTIFGSVLIGGFALFLVGVPSIDYIGYVTRIDTDIIIPVVSVLCFVGAFTVNTNYLDVFVTFAFGAIGYLMLKYDYSVVGFIMGVILGPIIEQTLFQSLQLGGGSYLIFVESPLSIVLVVLILAAILAPLRQYLSNR